jgi:ribosomal protein S18 acetylase RimI-like enzyme
MLLRRGTSADLAAVVNLQFAAYARNRTILGVEPIPLQADYTDILATMEVWLAESEATDGAPGLDGVLILEPRGQDLLIWSIATMPGRQERGLGRDLLAFAEHRTRMLRLPAIRLYTGTKLLHLVDWYTRRGFVTERVEETPDRSITHMLKPLHYEVPPNT